MNDSFDCGYFVVFNRSIYWTGWNILQFNKVELNTQSRKDKLINLSFRLCVLILSNFIELNFTVWNYLIQVEFHSVKFLNSTRSTFDFVEWNWTSWIRIQFISLQLVYSNGIHRLKWKMNGLNSSSNEFPSTCVFHLNIRVEMKDERVNEIIKLIRMIKTITRIDQRVNSVALNYEVSKDKFMDRRH